MKILSGGIKSKFDGDEGAQQNGFDHRTMLLQVHGRSKLNTKATQVELSACSLNMNDCFILTSPSETFVWMGKGCTGDERFMAKELAYDTHSDPTTIFEGQESEEFWNLLGGQRPYMNEKIIKMETEDDAKPRLFQGSDASGSFKMEEIYNFGQMDLIPEDVMLLDVGDALFVWIGQDSNENEKRHIQELAKEYLEADPSGRNVDIPVISVKQGNEPPNFTGFFGAWDSELKRIY